MNASQRLLGDLYLAAGNGVAACRSPGGRVLLSAELVSEFRGRVGRLVPYATGSSGSFATRVRRLTGIEGFHVHQMRQTFACQWLARGGSLAAPQQVLGHASFTTTQRHARISDEAVIREAARLAANNGARERNQGSSHGQVG